MEQNNFFEELQKQFPQISEGLSSFLRDPKAYNEWIGRCDYGIKQGKLYYIIHDRRPNPTTSHNFIPGHIHQIVAHVLVPQDSVQLSDIKNEFAPEVDNGLQVGMDTPAGYDHMTISLGYVNDASIDNSMKSTVRRLIKWIKRKEERR